MFNNESISLIAAVKADFVAFFNEGGNLYPVYDDAFAACEAQGMTLAVIKSASEQEEAYNVAKESLTGTFVGSPTMFHIGIRRENGKQQLLNSLVKLFKDQAPWLWDFINDKDESRKCDPKKMGQVFWGEGEPSNDFDSGNFCGRINVNDERYPIKNNWTTGNCAAFNGYTGYICSSKVSDSHLLLLYTLLGCVGLVRRSY